MEMNQLPLREVDHTLADAHDELLFTNYVEFDFKITNDFLETVITLLPNQYIRSIWVENLKSYESWALLADKTYSTKPEIIAVCAEVTIPQQKFELYQRLLASGRVPLYLIDPSFPYEYYDKIIQSKTTVVDRHGQITTSYTALAPHGRYVYEDDPVTVPFKGVETHTESVLKSVKGLAVIHINGALYDKDKLPIIWANIVTIG